jgi:hypothetical protein
MAESTTTTAAQTPDTGTTSTTAASDGQSTQATWRDTLPDELKASPVLSKYTDQNAALKALVEAQDLIGRKSEGIKVPGPDAKPEERESFFKALGRPDTPDQYVMPTVEGIPEGMGIRPEVEQAAKAGLHKLGLTTDQFNGAMQLLMQQSVGEYQKAQAFKASERKALEDTYKDALPARLDLALRAARAEGGEDLVRALDASGAGNYRAVIEYFAKRGETLGETGMKGGPGAPGSVDFSKLSPVERINKAREMGITS